MGKIRKYWIGYSNEADHKPTEFETFTVYNEDEMLDAQHDIAILIAEDYLTEDEENG